MTKRYNVIVWDRIPQKGDEKDKVIPRTVGNAKHEDGKDNIDVFITKGIAVSGNFTLSPWKDKEED